jgi:hypothetical protein
MNQITLQKQEGMFQPQENSTIVYCDSEPNERRLTNRAAGNICFKKLGLSHFAGEKSKIGSSVQRMRFSAKIPLHLKAQARYRKCYWDSANLNLC